ncbi:hypothetical protein SMKI_04G6120 [Saccharomyces mikatae IFO 1815]|uniref:Derlin n=1 Tax=Saccharomyces mikatae IFO 1815 TaxID=226126 RepID=A0AA35IY57_SACMI|nr:uncharacterized protein SMKI_04G6120 [Saccharomyces mikatae IFO 1815]CAI4038270.1 hypothetical protein SMKI_04G6120 [Saccharomyces mikatae IFO 1815]
MAGPRNVRTLNGNGNRNDDVMGPKEFWLSIPPVTRTLFTLAIAMTIVARLHLIGGQYFAYVWSSTFKKVQLWRLLTSCLMLSPRAMPALMELYSIYDRSSQLERVHFGPGLSNRRGPLVTVDYVYYLCFCILTITMATTILYGSNYLFVLTSGFISCITYTWSIDNANVQIMFYGLIPVWGKYFPLIQLFISFVFNEGDFAISLIGFATGYLYTCLDTHTLGPIWGMISRKSDTTYGILPNGKFPTPWWFTRLYARITGAHNEPAILNSNFVNAPSTPRETRTFSGRGQRLGTASATSSQSSGTNSARTSGSQLRSGSSSLNQFQGRGQRVGQTNSTYNPQ